MEFSSAYITQTQLISLGSRPLLSKECFRPAFQPLFASKNCFTDLRASALEEQQKIQLPSKPFIRNLGRICFNMRSARTTNYSVRGSSIKNMMMFLLKTENYRDANAEIQQLKIDDYFDYHHNIFGLDVTLKDQRMNHFYFELFRPVHVKAEFCEKTKATGKIFLHLYPSGYLLILVAISLLDQTLNNFEKALLETRPWRRDNKWIWVSKFGKTTLDELVNIVRRNTFETIYSIPPTTLPKSEWRTALKLGTKLRSQEIASLFVQGNYEALELGSVYLDSRGLAFKKYWEEQKKPTRQTFSVLDKCWNKTLSFLFENLEKLMLGSSKYESLLTSSQGLFCALSPKRGRRSSLRLFWKIFSLYEFVLVKNRIYRDCAEILRKKIIELKYSPVSNSQEDSEFDQSIPLYLTALDGHIRFTSSFNRRIYSSISQGIKFDSQRQKVKELIKDWEEQLFRNKEYEKISIWNRVIKDKTWISPDTHKTMRAILYNCEIFNNETALSSLLTDPKLRRWNIDLAGISSSLERIDTAIERLYDEFNDDGDNALILFIETLSERIDKSTYFDKDLNDLAVKLKNEVKTYSINCKKKITILFLSSNPSDNDDLKLNKEFRAIDDSLQKSEFSGVFDFRQCSAVKVKDLQENLLRFRPHIVHFSGHTNKKSREILLVRDDGKSDPVSKSALSQLFSLVKNNVRCVVLNACLTEEQAKAIAEHIDCVIGTSEEISDPSAINFSRAFYRAIGFGKNVKEAYEWGCNEIKLENPDECKIPRIIPSKIRPENIVFIRDDRS